MSMLGKMLGFGRNEQYDRAIRLFDQGLYEESVSTFEHLLASPSKDAVSERLALFYSAEAHANLGHGALKRGAWERAQKHFEAALSIHPHYPDLHYNLALVLRHRFEYEAALQSLDRALEINPRFAKAHFQRGLVLYAMGRRDEGVGSIGAAVVLEPGFATEAYYRGAQSHEDGDWAAALHAFEMVSSTEVDDILFHYRLGDDLYRRGLFRESAEEYQKALDLNPSYADIHNRKGVALSALGSPEEALAEYDNALACNPRYIEAWLNRGVALRELGRHNEASTAFSRALDLDPGNPLAIDNLAEAERAKAA